MRNEMQSRESAHGKRSARNIFAEARKLYNVAQGAQDYNPGFNLLRQAADLGLPEAHEWLGFVYHCGFGTQPNRRLAFKHYKIAADARQPNAEYHVGISYHDGIGVRKDSHRAVVWIRRAAKHGSASAVYWLGWHDLASGIPRLRKRGFQVVLSAAKRGEPQAQHAVAVCYEKGVGVGLDMKSAFRWYLRAAKRGYPYAADALGRLYEAGEGVRMNRRKAAFWYERAGDSRGKSA